MTPTILHRKTDQHDLTASLYYGDDVRTTLRSFPDKSIHLVCTSPPYWGLRDYLTGEWVGGDISCDHEQGRDGCGRADGQVDERGQRNRDGAIALTKGVCSKCGAIRVDSQIGLEPTPEEYVQHLVEVFQEIGRVLRDDGLVYLNLGDTYWGGGSTTTYGQDPRNFSEKSTLGGVYTEGQADRPIKPRAHPRLKVKDLIGVPWMVAFALRDAGWFLRQDCIWQKTNGMPSPAYDRFVSSHEYIFMLSKKARYYFDCDAVSELVENPGKPRAFRDAKDHAAGTLRQDNGRMYLPQEKRFKRSVWTLSTQPFRGAHFATWPQALVEPMILSGTSEVGCCAECGTPYRRIIEKIGGRDWREDEMVTIGIPGELSGEGPYKRGRSREPLNDVQKRVTKGWEKTCRCPCTKTMPCTVLDPFSGSGTTGHVAFQLGRNYIGIDLNEGYLSLAKERILGYEEGSLLDILSME